MCRVNVDYYLYGQVCLSPDQEQLREAASRLRVHHLLQVHDVGQQCTAPTFIDLRHHHLHKKKR